MRQKNEPTLLVMLRKLPKAWMHAFMYMRQVFYHRPTSPVPQRWWSIKGQQNEQKCMHSPLGGFLFVCLFEFVFFSYSCKILTTLWCTLWWCLYISLSKNKAESNQCQKKGTKYSESHPENSRHKYVVWNICGHTLSCTSNKNIKYFSIN